MIGLADLSSSTGAAMCGVIWNVFKKIKKDTDGLEISSKSKIGQKETNFF